MALNDAVPSTATDVFNRNVQDIDRIVNETANVTTRTGRVMESFPMSTERATTEADRAEAAQVGVTAAKDAAAASAATATTKANEAAGSSLTAEQAAQTALATGNYAGQWSTLSGAYNAGISVEHNNIFYALRSNTSNIASITPGVSAEWIAINGANLGTAATRDVGTASGEIQTNSQNRVEFAAKSGGVFTTDINVSGLTVGRGGGNVASNTAIGLSALDSNTTGAYNTASGRNALILNTTGAYNTASGYDALSLNTTGAYNTASGYYALRSNTTFDNCSGLGFDAQVTGSGQVQLGGSNTTTYAYGAVQNRSDIRDKADVRDTELGLDFINALRPVDFRWDMREDYRQDAPEKSEGESDESFKSRMDEWLKSVKLGNIEHDGTHKRSRYHHGLIAQEVRSVIDNSGIDFGGFQDHKLAGGDDVLSLGYEELIAPLIKAVQELTARIDLLEGDE